jgi:hypothetical protein
MAPVGGSEHPFRPILAHIDKPRFIPANGPILKIEAWNHVLSTA